MKTATQVNEEQSRRQMAKRNLAYLGTHDLLGVLRRQFPAHMSTMANCPICTNPSRGGDYCKDCIAAELKARGAGEGEIADLLDARDHARQIQHRIDDLQKAIIGKIEAKAGDV